MSITCILKWTLLHSRGFVDCFKIYINSIKYCQNEKSRATLEICEEAIMNELLFLTWLIIHDIQEKESIIFVILFYLHGQSRLKTIWQATAAYKFIPKVSIVLVSHGQDKIEVFEVLIVEERWVTTGRDIPLDLILLTLKTTYRPKVVFKGNF